MSLRKRILALADLKADWDSYGADPVSPSAIGCALALLNFAFDTVQPDTVTPTNEGGICFTWQKPGVYFGVVLEMEINPAGDKIAWVKMVGLASEHGQCDPSNPEQVEPLLEWYAGQF